MLEWLVGMVGWLVGWLFQLQFLMSGRELAVQVLEVRLPGFCSLRFFTNIWLRILLANAACLVLNTLQMVGQEFLDDPDAEL